MAVAAVVGACVAVGVCVAVDAAAVPLLALVAPLVGTDVEVAVGTLVGPAPPVVSVAAVWLVTEAATGPWFFAVAVLPPPHPAATSAPAAATAATASARARFDVVIPAPHGS